MTDITFRVPPAVVYVAVDGNHVGSIRHNEYTGTWSFKYQKADTREEEFTTLQECKASLDDIL